MVMLNNQRVYSKIVRHIHLRMPDICLHYYHLVMTNIAMERSTIFHVLPTRGAAACPDATIIKSLGASWGIAPFAAPVEPGQMDMRTGKPWEKRKTHGENGDLSLENHRKIMAVIRKIIFLWDKTRSVNGVFLLK